MSPYQDFDSWLEEPEPVEWTWRGRRYSIPGGLPTRLALKIQSEGGGNVDMLREAMGGEEFDALVENTNTAQFEKITEWAMNKLTGQAERAEKADPKAELEAAARAAVPSRSPAATSSSTGRQSSSTPPAIGLVPRSNSGSSATAAS